MRSPAAIGANQLILPIRTDALDLIEVASMGWFLRSTTSESNKGGGHEADNSSESGHGFWLVVGWAIVIGGGAVVWAGADQWLRPRVAKKQTTAPLLTMTTPDWMPKPLVDDLKHLARNTLVADPFDRTSLQATADTMAANPWIRKLIRVQRRADNTVEIVAEFRKPAALVHYAGRWYLVDTEGVRVSKFASSTDTKPSEALLKLSGGAITGIVAPRPKTGQLWKGEDLSAALKLISLIHENEFANQVRMIDAANHKGRQDAKSAHLVIQTHRGGWVLWGRAPGEEGIYEPDSQAKLKNLSRIRLAHDGRIDANGSGWMVDLTQPGTWIYPAR